MTTDYPNHHDHKGRGKRGRNRRLGEATRHRHEGYEHGFGPFMGGPAGRHPMHGGPRRRRAKGDIRIAILAILSAPETRETNGYGIMRAIGEATEGAWTPSPGSVYPTLQQLVDEGLIEPDGAGRGTVYRLSDEGRAYAEEHAETLAGWARAERPSDATRAMWDSAGRLMQVLGQYRHGATDSQLTQAAAKLDEVRKALYLILAE